MPPALRHRFLTGFCLLLLGCVCRIQAAPAASLLQQPEASGFIREMADRHGFSEAKLEDLFAVARFRPSVLRAMSRPAEVQPWYRYRRRFLTRERIEGGASFWRAWSGPLEQARSVYGVPPEVVVAILGIESRYGRNTGSTPVLESLATLAFGYPKRAGFFRGELEQYLLLTREEEVKPLAARGSYAGAMGLAQFMPSSYRRYAVDFDGDGKRDLWDEPADAIGSVANYLHAHGWQPGQPIVLPASARAADPGLLERGLAPWLALGRMRELGILSETSQPDDSLGAVFRLETPEGFRYWVGLANFYTITRYNHSALYAMAVVALAREVRAEHDDETR